MGVREGEERQRLDALIASTVAAVGATLATFNRRYFPMLVDVHVPYVRPQP